MITTAVIHDHRQRSIDKPGPIEVRVTYNRKVYYINTGIKVLARNFVGGTVINQIDSSELNTRVRIIYNRIQAEVNKCMGDGRAIDIDEIRRNVWKVAEDVAPDSSPLLDWLDEQIGRLHHKPGTMKHYETLMLRMRAFGKIRRWKDLTVENICEFDLWLHQLPARQPNAEVKAGVPPQPISDGSVYNYHKCLKSLLNRAVLFDELQRNPYDKLRGQFARGDRESVEYLTEEELKNFEATTPPRGSLMDVAHDLFIFQAYTGLSYSDAQAFDFGNYKRMTLQGADGLKTERWCYVGERIKTGVPFVSQLLPPVVSVLEKYNWQVPQIENRKYNVCLKALGMVAGIDRPLHSHMARHTFATMMLRMGVKIENVSRMLGHTNIIQTQRYAKVLAQSVHDEYDMVAEKLKDR